MFFRKNNLTSGKNYEKLINEKPLCGVYTYSKAAWTAFVTSTQNRYESKIHRNCSLGAHRHGVLLVRLWVLDGGGNLPHPARQRDHRMDQRQLRCGRVPHLRLLLRAAGVRLHGGRCGHLQLGCHYGGVHCAALAPGTVVSRQLALPAEGASHGGAAACAGWASPGGAPRRRDERAHPPQPGLCAASHSFASGAPLRPIAHPAEGHCSAAFRRPLESVPAERWEYTLHAPLDSAVSFQRPLEPVPAEQWKYTLHAPLDSAVSFQRPLELVPAEQWEYTLHAPLDSAVSFQRPLELVPAEQWEYTLHAPCRRLLIGLSPAFRQLPLHPALTGLSPRGFSPYSSTISPEQPSVARGKKHQRVSFFFGGASLKFTMISPL